LRLSALAFAPILLSLVSYASPVPADRTVADTISPVVLRYRLNPGEMLRYRLTANVHGSVPILDSPEPTELNAVVRIVYIATPKTKLSDGTSDVDFKVETAELEVEKIPFPIPDDQAREILNQTISMAQTGEVKRVQQGKPLPFGVSIPGVDPKRLYALLFPIVFQERAVRPGDKWSYKSELLGGQGASPEFTATLLPAGSTTKQRIAGGTKASAPGVSPASTRLQEDFQMGVDQKLDKDKKPLKEGDTLRYTRQGRIEGSGVFNFDRAKGRVQNGTVTIRANVKEDLVGAPDREDQPKQMVSKVDATVTVQLEPKPDKPLAVQAGGTTTVSAKKETRP
jgi:hypothetical protein